MRLFGVSIGKTYGLTGKMAAVLGVASLALAVPSASFAIGLIGGHENFSTSESFASFTPASADPRLAKLVAARAGGKARMMRFTPAGMSSSGKRALTVAIRVGERQAQAIEVRSAIEAARDQVAAADGSLRIAPTRYNLGLARGYRNFTPSTAATEAPALSKSLSEAKIPDLADFAPSPGVKKEPSRFGARIALDEPVAARTARVQDHGDRSIDAAASYRVTRNLDVRAGVRYEQDRNSVTALPDLNETDSQAVYVGTQFRF